MYMYITNNVNYVKYKKKNENLNFFQAKNYAVR